MKNVVMLQESKEICTFRKIEEYILTKKSIQVDKSSKNLDFHQFGRLTTVNKTSTENDWIILGDVIQADVGRACSKLNWWNLSSSKN